MTPRTKATIALQSPYWRNSSREINVCPECGIETSVFIETQDGKPIEVHRCVLHGDVVPILSEVLNHGDKPGNSNG